MYNIRESTMPFEFKLNTNGKGYWSDTVKEVQVTKIELDVIEKDFGELRVYFDPKTWSTRKDGLIYTDEQFMDELRGALEVAGLDDSDISYSEQGMQGALYVSLDVCSKFINSWDLKDSFKEWTESDLAGK